MAIAWLIGATPVWASHLRGEIARVGFPGSGSLATGMGGDIYRVGRYVPVVIDLANDDGDQFEGMVEVRQTDADGDEVISAQEVAVRGRRRLFLYVPGGPVNENNFGSGGSSGPLPFSVRVFDRQGRLAQLFDDRNEPVKDLRPPRPVIAAPTGAMLILDMSQRPVSPLDSVKVFKHVQDVIVMRCGPKDLPDSVVGIEMVDVIVWDAADPTVLDPLQNDAIMAWLKRGGHLIVGTGKDWNALSSSKFGPLLPAYLSGVQSSADPAVFRDLLPKRAAEQDNDSTPARSVALTYCPVTATGLANDAFAVLPRFAEGDRQVWLSRRDCGRGQITLASTELLGMLSTILAADPKNETLLRDSLLRLREMPDPNSETGLNTGGLIGRRDVFALVGSETSFQQTSSLYFAFAFAFVIGYIVLVSGGTWGWLWRRGTIRHAWVIFAALAVATSGVSLMAVQLVRALGSGVHEATIVDG